MEENTNFVESLAVNTKPNQKLSFQIEGDYETAYVKEAAKEGVVVVSNVDVTYIPRRDYSGKDGFVLNFSRNNNSITLHVAVVVGYPFRAKSHILSLLGDELIGSDNLAIFELVKNAYDADAKRVIITFKNLNTENQAIIIEDDGDGMSLDTLQNVWLEIGTDFKRGKKRKPSKKYERISLGEKGVGRLAVHKLGKRIVLETQPDGSSLSYRLELNWQQLIEDSNYIDETSVEIQTINESLFTERKGTRLIIGDLKKKLWTRAELRDLARKVYSIRSPFKEVKGPFDVDIRAEKYEEWIKDIKQVDRLLDDCVYYFDFQLKKHTKCDFAAFSWNYEFSPPKSFDIKDTYESKIDKTNSEDTDDLFHNVFNIKVEKNEILYQSTQRHLLNSDLAGIGEISGRFYVFNLQAIVLRAFGQAQAIKQFVKENCGVKIFRDGIRVYNYGEPGDDWLGLDLARVQRLGSHFSKNVTIGSVEISQEGSFQGLKEKTNREGFDENIIFEKFRNICGQVFRHFESIAQKDRDRFRDYLEGLGPGKIVGLSDTINEISIKLKGHSIEKTISPLLKRVEKDYNDMRDVMLSSGMTGINLGIVFHEVDREVKFINSDLKKNSNIDVIKERVQNLIHLLDGFGPILKQNKNVATTAKGLVEKARNLNNPRFNFHRIIFSSPLLSLENDDFQIFGPGNLLISALSNIIDNAIYWIDIKRELTGESFRGGIYIGSDLTNFNGPAIIIADNGAGFSMEPEDLIRPYLTTRPGGMGLGLYFVNLVMEMIGGKLLFPDKEEFEIPRVYDGALLALVFPRT